MTNELINDRLTHAKARLDAYYAAETAVLLGQEYKLGNRSLKRADLAEIRAAITDIENLVSQLTSQAAGNGRNRAFGIIPRDI
jgi:hypothetical protein